MQRVMLKSKIHRARVTDADLDYEGSLTIDRTLLELADILPYEQVKVYNVSTGARFDTYAIAGPAGAGDFCLNGAAARLGARGDTIIIATYAQMEDAEAARYQPRVVLLDGHNRPRPVTKAVAAVGNHA
ncbi:MAG: aspartate 1-decarboxylase [Syntrophobacteraceae bacterium CG2_30_61_12]|nr:MAG: aspartate 1-decarboxylase [Syntrophobacteraceae bacterium CG2_30_61_12]